LFKLTHYPFVGTGLTLTTSYGLILQIHSLRSVGTNMKARNHAARVQKPKKKILLILNILLILSY